jgi:hypothetical protein
MRRELSFFSITALVLMLFPMSRTILAEERDEPSVGESQSDAAKASSAEIAPLPARLTEEQFRALQELRPAVPPASQIGRHRRAGFFRNTAGHPLTPREIALRETVYELAGRPKQYVHLRLVNGKVLTGTIGEASTEAFLLKTGILGGGHTFHYRELAEPPRPVLAVGTRTVKGLEVTGLVVVCIAAIPLVVVLYPLILAGVIRD